MKLTIVPSDRTVYKDGIAMEGLLLTEVPPNVHALQWFEDKGWIEFTMSDDFSKPANQTITELPAWASSALVEYGTKIDVQNNQIE